MRGYVVAGRGTRRKAIGLLSGVVVQAVNFFLQCRRMRNSSFTMIVLGAHSRNAVALET